MVPSARAPSAEHPRRLWTDPMESGVKNVGRGPERLAPAEGAMDDLLRAHCQRGWSLRRCVCVGGGGSQAQHESADLTARQ